MSKIKRRKIKRRQKGIRAGNIKMDSVMKKFKKGYVVLLIFFLLLSYIIYAVIAITKVSQSDPLVENGSSLYLLSKASFSDLDKTLWVFEDGVGKDSRISKAFLIASNKDKSFLLNIYIPGWLYFPPNEEDFGDAISVSNFRYAGDFLEEGRGIEYAIWEFEQMLGTKINNYVWLGEKEQNLYSDIFGYYGDYKGTFHYDSSEEDFTQDALFLDSFISKFSFLKVLLHPSKVSQYGEGLVSNRSLVDVLRKISQTNNQLKRYEKHIIDLGNPIYLKEELSTTGGVAYYFNFSAYDEVFRKYLFNVLDRELEKEQVRVEVYNGSSIPGAAGQMARKIENTGCDVIRYENAPDMIESTILYIPNRDRFEKSLATVKEILGADVKIVDGRPAFMTTGDIIVVLGRDIERMYSF